MVRLKPDPTTRQRYNRFMFRYGFAALALALTIACAPYAIGCGKTEPPAETDRAVLTSTPTTSTAERDIHSYARPDEVRVTHVALDLAADFDAHILSGTATLSLQRNGSASEVVLDTKGMEIQRISAGSADLMFALGNA